jgi:hypothetical protein
VGPVVRREKTQWCSISSPNLPRCPSSIALGCPYMTSRDLSVPNEPLCGLSRVRSSFFRWNWATRLSTDRSLEVGLWDWVYWSWLGVRSVVVIAYLRGGLAVGGDQRGEETLNPVPPLASLFLPTLLQSFSSLLPDYTRLSTKQLLLNSLRLFPVRPADAVPPRAR